MTSETAAIPGFELPWHAQAFALKSALETQGLFSAQEWSQALGAALAARRSDGPVDGGAGYWAAWQDALEALVAAKAGLDAASLDQVTEGWRHAYLATPHGQPVRLGATPGVKA